MRKQTADFETDRMPGEIVAEFYNRLPFPGSDPKKYCIPGDLYKNANTFSRLLDDQIPWGKSILDAGCGTGQLACLLSIKERKTLAIDFSDNSLAKGKEIKDKLNLENLTFRKEDLLELNAEDESYDYIFCHDVLQHTNNPYLGFQNIIKFAKSGTYIIIGLYNKYGRLRLRNKRRRADWKYKNSKEEIPQALQDMRAGNEKYTEKQNSGYQDQSNHPRELTHTIAELLNWYDKNGFEYINSLPPIELFRREQDATQIFKKSSVKGWRNSKFAHFIKQLKWVISLRKTGGYYMIVGRKL